MSRAGSHAPREFQNLTAIEFSEMRDRIGIFGEPPHRYNFTDPESRNRKGTDGALDQKMNFRASCMRRGCRDEMIWPN